MNIKTSTGQPIGHDNIPPLLTSSKTKIMYDQLLRSIHLLKICQILSLERCTTVKIHLLNVIEMRLLLQTQSHLFSFTITKENFCKWHALLKTPIQREQAHYKSTHVSTCPEYKGSQVGQVESKQESQWKADTGTSKVNLAS